MSKFGKFKCNEPSAFDFFLISVNQKQLRAHEEEAAKLKEYFDDNMATNQKSSYDFLLKSPKTIINDLCNELKGETFLILCILRHDC